MKCVILWTQVACVLMRGCRWSDGVCDPSFVAQGIMRSCGDQHHVTVMPYLGGVNGVLPASSTFLIRFGQLSVQAVSANNYRVAKIFVKIRPMKAMLSVGTQMNFICNFRICGLICVD